MPISKTDTPLTLDALDCARHRLVRPAQALARTAALAAGLGIGGALAGDPAVDAFVASGALDFIEDPALIEAVRAQNTANAGLSQADIDALDTQWRAEIGTGATPTIDAVVGSAASAYLRERIEAGSGLFTEVFVMDALGLNVASASVTSDYWQGDEAKYSETYLVGPEAVHVGEVERDESTMTYQVQISITLSDPDTGEAIGAATFGVDAEALF